MSPFNKGGFSTFLRERSQIGDYRLLVVSGRVVPTQMEVSRLTERLMQAAALAPLNQVVPTALAARYSVLLVVNTNEKLSHQTVWVDWPTLSREIANYLIERSINWAPLPAPITVNTADTGDIKKLKSLLSWG